MDKGREDGSFDGPRRAIPSIRAFAQAHTHAPDRQPPGGFNRASGQRPRFPPQGRGVSWRGQLTLHYRRDAQRTTAHDRHEGPLRVLQRLYPEGPGICHHVLVHPPGGIVGGDVLEIDATLEPGTHALITTPGATRFYRSSGAAASQSALLRVADGARLEWLPLETIAFTGCVAENRVRIELAPGAETIGWDVLALGLPASFEPFSNGVFTQHLELPGRWLERGCIAASDKRLLDSPLGLAGQRVIATLWFAAGAVLPEARTQTLLDVARECASGSALAPRCGVTSPHDGVVLLRVLADRVEPAMALLARVRGAWRGLAWGLAAAPPRVWRT
jgi:urease accessory protein